MNRYEGEFQEADASLNAAAAARDIARLNLEFTRVTAPFDGTISGSVLSPGNVAAADTTVLAAIIAVDPLHAEFQVPQNLVLSLNRLMRDGQAPRRAGSLGLPGPATRRPSEQAKVEFADVQLDATNGISPLARSDHQSRSLPLAGHVRPGSTGDAAHRTGHSLSRRRLSYAPRVNRS